MDMGLLCKSFKGTLFCISSIIQRRGKPGNETRSLTNVVQCFPERKQHEMPPMHHRRSSLRESMAKSFFLGMGGSPPAARIADPMNPDLPDVQLCHVSHVHAVSKSACTCSFCIAGIHHHIEVEGGGSH